MRWLLCALAGFLALVLVGCGSKSTSSPDPAQSAPGAVNSEPEKKELTNKDKIVGPWEVTKSIDAPPGTVLEFTKDGKMKRTFKVEGKELTLEMTYTMSTDQITASGPLGNKETSKIKKLTDTELTIEYANGKVEEYKKKK